MSFDALKSATQVFRQGSVVSDAVTVILSDGGIVYDAWTSVRIGRSLNQLSANFSISLVDKWREQRLPWFLKPGVRCVVKIGAFPVINGFIDRLDVDISNDDRRVEITGRDITGDLVDSSAPTEPAEFKNVTITTLATRFAAQFGIPVLTEVDVFPVFPKFTVKQGETIFELLQRAANLRGLLLLSDETGSLRITNRSSAESAVVASTPLVQGQNVITARASFDNSERFQTYIAKGQSEGSDLIFGLNVTSPIGTSVDASIVRPRQKTVIADGSTDFTGAQKRANWENTVRAAKSTDVSVKVQGWQQFPGGPLWQVNQLVNVDIGFLGIQANQLLIQSLQFTKSLNEGTVTTLNLTRRDAFIPEQVALNPANDPQATLGWNPAGGGLNVGDLV